MKTKTMDTEEFFAALLKKRKVTKTLCYKVGSKNVTMDADMSSITIGNDTVTYPVYGIHGLDKTPSRKTIYLNKKADNWIRSYFSVQGSDEAKKQAKVHLKKMKKLEERKEKKKEDDKKDKKKKDKKEKDKKDKKDQVKKEKLRALTPFEELDAPEQNDDASLEELLVSGDIYIPLWKYASLFALTDFGPKKFKKWYKKAGELLKTNHGRKCIAEVGSVVKAAGNTWSSRELNAKINNAQTAIEKRHGVGSFPYEAICAAFLSVIGIATVVPPSSGKGSEAAAEQASRSHSQRRVRTESAKKSSKVVLADFSDDDSDDDSDNSSTSSNHSGGTKNSDEGSNDDDASNDSEDNSESDEGDSDDDSDSDTD